MNSELCAIVRGPYGSYDCATVVSISELSHNRTRALADERLMFQSSSQQDVVAKRRLCSELNESFLRRTDNAPRIDCSVSSGLP